MLTEGIKAPHQKGPSGETSVFHGTGSGLAGTDCTHPPLPVVLAGSIHTQEHLSTEHHPPDLGRTCPQGAGTQPRTPPCHAAQGAPVMAPPPCPSLPTCPPTGAPPHPWLHLTHSKWAHLNPRSKPQAGRSLLLKAWGDLPQGAPHVGTDSHGPCFDLLGTEESRPSSTAAGELPRRVVM